jgi:hypothetical protein
MMSPRFSTTSMLGLILTGPSGTKIMGLISYTLVSSPRDSTRIVDSG